MQSAAFRERLLSHVPTGSKSTAADRADRTAEIEDVAAATTTLDRLHASNFALCIDDFGAGAAAFRYLRDFRMDYVTIDGASVHTVMRNRRDHRTGRVDDRTCAIGRGPHNRLDDRDHGTGGSDLDLCATFGQGWLLARSMPLPFSSQSMIGFTGRWFRCALPIVQSTR
jgi:hypothetical protein